MLYDGTKDVVAGTKKLTITETATLNNSDTITQRKATSLKQDNDSLEKDVMYKYWPPAQRGST